MVNLAKLRKKAKEKKSHSERSEESGRVEGAQAEPVEPPAAQIPRSARNDADKIAAYLATAGETHIEAKKEEAPEAGALLELLTFMIAGEHYAIAIDDVVEIVTPRSVTRIPNADPSVVGILSLRGTIVMLVDARKRLRHPPSNGSSPETRIIVVQNETDHVGFEVDQVLRVVKIDAAGVQPHPVVHSSEQDESVRGVFRHGDALTILLDLSKLISTNTGWN